MAELKTHIAGECRACRTKFIYLLTGNGKLIPVDANTVEPDDKFFNYQKHKSHFATCPRPEIFRKKPKVDPEEEKRKQEEAFRKDLERSIEEIKNDKRPFIVHNKIEVTVPRYSYLNRCVKLGMGYDDLISLDNTELRLWLSERGVTEETEVQLTLI